MIKIFINAIFISFTACELVDKDEKLVNIGKLNYFSYRSSKAKYWLKGVVYYEFHNTFKITFQGLILYAKKHIESRSCIRFKERNNQVNYICFVNGAGCFSHIGMIGGLQKLTLSHKCRNLGVFLHEILHALGINHEHQRYDRDKYLTIHWENMENKSFPSFNLLAKSKNKYYKKFDYDSIMIYGSRAFSKNGQETITPRVKGVKLLSSFNKISLSESDFITLNEMYKCDKKNKHAG